jgi:hypothetical protein
MSGRLPAAARRALQDGALSYVAVRTPHGPHLTPVVFVLDAGHLWVTTARTSVKARTWRDDPEIAGLVRTDDVTVAFRGMVRTYDALDPLSWPAAAVAGPRLVRAATRFSLKNARFFAGYAVDARRVPLAWTPPGRVFARIELAAGRVLEDADQLAREGWGWWRASPVEARASYRALPPAGGVALRIPREIRRVVGSNGEGVMAFATSAGITALAVRWRRVAREDSFEAVVPLSSLALAGTPARPFAALTIDHASTWRASEMTGVLLQGPSEVFVPGTTRSGRAALHRRIETVWGPDVPARPALVRLRPLRAVWWEGWSSGTVRGPHR